MNSGLKTMLGTVGLGLFAYGFFIGGMGAGNFKLINSATVPGAALALWGYGVFDKGGKRKRR